MKRRFFLLPVILSILLLGACAQKEDARPRTVLTPPESNSDSGDRQREREALRFQIDTARREWFCGNDRYAPAAAAALAEAGQRACLTAADPRADEAALSQARLELKDALTALRLSEIGGGDLRVFAQIILSAEEKLADDALPESDRAALRAALNEAYAVYRAGAELPASDIEAAGQALAAVLP